MDLSFCLSRHVSTVLTLLLWSLFKVFEGVYNNARMLHYLTAVVGSTCDIRVKNGSVYEGIFKTLSSRCELAVDAVHRRCEVAGGSSAPPRREEITDTMIFSPSDMVTMTCRDVDLSFATRDSFTDTAISASRVNGEHKEKVLQRWEGGDSNGENYDLETDASNGWDANEMFRFNEENYGIKSTYDSSLSLYTVPLERGNSEGFRQREARAARLASEIESSPQYRHRVALENEDGKTDEDRFSAVVRERDGGERERGRESPRERDRGRDSPSCGNREGKYIPLPQRAREIGTSSSGIRGERGERGERGGGGATTPSLPNRMGGYHSSRPAPSSSSPRPPLPASSGQSASSSERSSPLSSRGGYSPHHPQGSPGSGTAFTSPASLGTSPNSPPAPHGQSGTPSLSHPHTLSDTTRPVNGVSSRTSPKSQRPVQTSRPLRTAATHSTPVVHLYSIRPALSVLSRTFTCFHPAQLQPSGSSTSTSVAASAESPQSSPAQTSPAEPVPAPGPKLNVTQDVPQPPAPSSPSEERAKDKEPEGTVGASAVPTIPAVAPDRQSPGAPQSARTPGSEEAKLETTERVEGVTDQVKKSTLNPNAKEFNPNKPPLTLVTPTPPRPTPPSPSVVLQPPPGQGPIYNSTYVSYMPQIHPVQSPSPGRPALCYSLLHFHVPLSPPLSLSGSVVAPRSDHSSSAPPMLQAAASAAGPPLVASPYPQSYLQYSPQQYSQQVIQSVSPYPGQVMSGARMLGTGGGHPQTLGPPGGPQFPGQGEGPPGPQQGIYAPQTFSHHSGSMHPPQPSSTPTGSQPPPQHTAPSPGQSAQSGPQTQSLYHSGPLSATTPPNMPPGHTSPQGSYPLQGYSLHGHQHIPHTYPPIGQLAQAHVPGALPGPHHTGTHAHHPMMLLHAPPPQQGPTSGPQHGPPPQQSTHQHYAYTISHPQVQVQAHPPQQLPFHPPGN
uniref:Ataxin 2-like n=1 Tax=Paramormyrops kingsleyae TaxID=1676925 RepID=A0A3B3R0P6_9TELE